MDSPLQVPATWTDDCQGKKDYDGDLVSVSTRYYPRGGGFHVLDSAKGTFEGNEARPEVPPSAVSTICLRSGGDDDWDAPLDLIRKQFKGETQEVVQRQVEAWVAEQYARVCAALRREFASESGEREIG